MFILKIYIGRVFTDLLLYCFINLVNEENDLECLVETGAMDVVRVG